MQVTCLARPFITRMTPIDLPPVLPAFRRPSQHLTPSQEQRLTRPREGRDIPPHLVGGDGRAERSLFVPTSVHGLGLGDSQRAQLGIGSPGHLVVIGLEGDS